MARFAADLESYYGNHKLSDVRLVIREDQVDDPQQQGRKRKLPPDDIVLPAHSMVLLTYSGFCRTKLENWSEADLPSLDSSVNQGHSIDITVPAGQLELAQRLIKGIYQQQPSYADLTPEQLLQLLMLADRYAVPKVQQAAADALQAAAAAGWPWRVVLDVLALPSSCSEQEAYKPVVATAVDKLQHQLGDLEVVWGDEQLQQQLLSLPHPALLQLLNNDQTCVASEHTVVYSILQWYQQQPAAARKLPELKQLLQQVRMEHCSALYITTLMMQCDTVLAVSVRKSSL